MKYPKLPVDRTDEALHDFAERYMVLKVAQMRKHWKDTFEDFLRGGNIDASTREAVIMRQAWNSALDMAADSLDCIAGRKSFFMDGEVSYAAVVGAETYYSNNLLEILNWWREEHGN